MKVNLIRLIRKSAVKMEFCQIAFCSFDYGNGYFDNDNGQTFLGGILLDIMVDNGEI